MKRWFIVLAAAACLLAGCRAEPDTQTSAPAAETQQSEPATQEELTELLMYEVELNERLVELVTFKSEVHRRWLFAEAFLQDTGLRFTELERDRLLRRITSVWWEQNYKKGAFNHYQFSREHPVNITLEQFTELPGWQCGAGGAALGGWGRAAGKSLSLSSTTAAQRSDWDGGGTPGTGRPDLGICRGGGEVAGAA